jgi:Rrf2 family protein
MAANSLLAGAVHALCFLAYKGEESVTAEDVARSLKTNPVVARRLLKSLELRGLVSIRHGRHGGVVLNRNPKDISLHEIHEAVEKGGLFAFRERGNQRCPVNQAMRELLTPVFDAADEAVAQSLRDTKLATLVEKIG